MRSNNNDTHPHNNTQLSSKPTFMSYVYYVYNFFQKPKVPLAIDNPIPKKIPRTRSTFLSNKTASLALPDKVEAPENVPPKKKPVINSTYTIYSVFNSILATFFKSPAPMLAPAPVVERPLQTQPNLPIENKDEPISNKMTAFQKKQKELSNQAEIDDLNLKRVELVANQIIEHAARRVDLFFYLLIAVYRKNVTINKASTTKQHGTGSKQRGTQACHCSLFSNVKLETITNALSIFMQPKENSTLKGTQFEESLNMTVELPNIVNAFDGHLEGRIKPSKYVQSCLTILNRASKNEIDPKEAMNEFLRVMNVFFSRFESKHIFSKTDPAPLATQKVWQYEKQGTFYAANEDKTINEDYIHLMLRLKPDEITQAKKNPKLLSDFYKRMQEEIYNNKVEPTRARNKKSMR